MLLISCLEFDWQLYSDESMDNSVCEPGESGLTKIRLCPLFTKPEPKDFCVVEHKSAILRPENQIMFMLITTLLNVLLSAHQYHLENLQLVANSILP